jgi:hypothetical protein
MSTINRASLATGLGLTVFLTACGMPNGDFPSLARRPYEIAGPNVEPVVIETARPTELTPELTEKMKSLTDRHDKASAAFEKGLPAVSAVAARAAGSAPGSETWVNAHLQLSRLDSLRNDSVASLGELDELISAQNDEDPAFVPLLTIIQEKMAAKVAEQRADVDRLSRQIGE